MRKLPYTYKNRKKLASGKVKDYWRYRRDGIDTPLPGDPMRDIPAMQKYAELEGDAERRIAKAADEGPGRKTFEWLARAYMASAEFEALKEITQGDYRRTIEGRLIPALGPERYDCMTRAMVKAVRDAVARKLSNRTAHKVKQTVSCIYAWADEEELVPEGFNPAASMKKLKGKSKAIEIWSREEIDLFLAHATGTARTIVMLGLYTGQRREDLVKMEWKDCLGDTIRVRQSKTGEPLMIACHPALSEHLKTIRTKFGGPVLRGADNGPMTANAMSRTLERAIDKIEGMPRRTPHGLRYAAAGELEAAGCSVVEISSVVGHRTYQMAMKYARQRRDAEAARDRWSENKGATSAE